MIKMSFREAQLLALGAASLKGQKPEFVELNCLQKFYLGDMIEVIEIRLDCPCIVVRIADGPESYLEVKYLADKIVDACVDVLREFAEYLDTYNN